MVKTLQSEKKPFERLEDSFSLPENQIKHPWEDEYICQHEKKLIEKIHEKNIEEEREKLLR
jgi:hypothetical protein